MAVAGEFAATLLESREIAPEVRHLVLETQGEARLSFAPGQFLMLFAPLGGVIVKRPYSIASPPDGNRFALCLNRVREGVFSPYLFDLRPGDTVRLKGPYGAFRWREPPSDSVLVATGTGIAPFRSMLHARVPEDPDRCYTLVFGVRHEYGILYREEFEEMAARFSNFRFLPTLTRPEPGWTGRTGRVQRHVLECVGDRRDLDVYICGLWEMVRDVRDKLVGVGVERSRIHYERYD
ncbi:MAG TPA: FAD-dependent oxidoreductase [Bryobacteraceae bacterium]|nr:FAD-dependent oxidoreductase [Bryobacteraceae bacterium]